MDKRTSLWILMGVIIYAGSAAMTHSGGLAWWAILGLTVAVECGVFCAIRAVPDGR